MHSRHNASQYGVFETVCLQIRVVTDAPTHWYDDLGMLLFRQYSRIKLEKRGALSLKACLHSFLDELKSFLVPGVIPKAFHLAQCCLRLLMVALDRLHAHRVANAFVSQLQDLLW